jgi:hypothetical protein
MVFINKKGRSYDCFASVLPICPSPPLDVIISLTKEGLAHGQDAPGMTEEP